MFLLPLCNETREKIQGPCSCLTAQPSEYEQICSYSLKREIRTRENVFAFIVLEDVMMTAVHISCFYLLISLYQTLSYGSIQIVF